MLEGTLTKVYNLGDQQANTLRQVLFGLYEGAGYSRSPAPPVTGAVPPTFEAIRAELQRAEATSLLGRLSPIFDLNLFRPERGALGELFTGAHVLRFTRLPGEEVKKACAEIVLLSCYQEMLRLGHYRGVRLALVIDEAHRIANLAAVSLLLREARAYGVAVFLSSQQARDFAEDIYANAETLIGLKVNETNDTERLGALLGGKSQARELAETIRCFQPGEAFMKNSAYQPQVRFRVTRLADRGS
jgi:DNA helicase HerA-like ATPase